MLHLRPSRRRSALFSAPAAACALFASLGCHAVINPPNDALEKLLKPVATSSDSVTLEIFYARVPLEKDAAADGIWQQVDEQCFDAELRRRLLANGMRVGVINGALPAELSDLLALTSEMPESSSDRVINGATATPRVVRQVKQISRRDSMAVQASEPRAKSVVMFSEGQILGSKEYANVRGVYTLRAEATDGQRVVVRIIPELHHGDFRNRYQGSDQGTFVTMPSQEKKVFDSLTMEATLAPGNLLVLGCLPNARASLGGAFHYAAAGGREERKLILVRLLQVPPTEILAKK
jgi:hypothetical protein